MTIEVKVLASSASELRDQIADLAATMGASAERDPATKPRAARSGAKNVQKTEEVQAGSSEEQLTGGSDENTTSDPAVPLATVTAAMERLIALGPKGAQATVQVVTELKAFDDKGLPKLSAVKPEDYARCLALIEAKIAELSATVSVM